MSCWESFCCFCSGPLENPREAWISHLAELMTVDEWPPKPRVPDRNSDQFNELVLISELDGAVWERCVCITPVATESFVSPPCSVDSYGSAQIEGWGRELAVGDKMLLIHSVCLSFVCRHNNITPKQLWESFFADASGYQSYRDEFSNGLLHCVDYYEMKKRAGQVFEYDFWEMKAKDSPYPKTINELQWLLSLPTCLPTPQRIHLVTSEGRPLQAGRKVFEIPELLDNILDHIVDVPVSVLESELKTSSDSFEARSAVTAAKTLLSLAQVSRVFYQAVVGNRQDLFFRAAKNFVWMLPFSPADWSDSEWPAAVTEGAAVAKGSDIDWRAYMLKCISKTTPNLRNRWRLHKMAVQFARGRNGHRFEEKSKCIWSAGSLGVKLNWQGQDVKVWEVNTAHQ